jgi:hypothetical protein
MTTIYIIQITKNYWRIESERGIIILDYIILSNPFEAREFITNYASSFGWNTEVRPL